MSEFLKELQKKYPHLSIDNISNDRVDSFQKEQFKKILKNILNKL